MKFTEFFWDFDGTLFDTYPRINSAMMKALNELGVQIEMEALARMTKVTVGHAASILLPGREKEVMQRYRAHYASMGIETFLPYEGAFRMLKSVCEHGGRNYLYTHSRSYTIDVLKYYGVDSLFADFITGDDGFASKPAPDALLSMIDKRHLDPAKCIMMGDRDIDLLAGQNAGIAGCMFDPDGYYADFDAQYRYDTYFDMMAGLVWENKAEDLHVSDMYAIQHALQSRHPEWGGLHPGRAKDQLLWMIGEAGEVIDILKKCKLQDIESNPELRARFVEEMADVAMYMNEVCLCLGVTEEEFSQAYFQKHLYNMKRDYKKANKERYGC